LAVLLSVIVRAPVSPVIVTSLPSVMAMSLSECAGVCCRE
jgi:hypothetical protein